MGHEAGSSRTPEQIEASNKFYTWTRGWRDGAGMRAIRPDHEAHPTLGATYSEAYASGQQAARDASAAASIRFGFTPLILRTADEQTSGTSAETKST